jgi:hypothetical protein
MAKRKFTAPLTDNHGDASSSAFSFTKRPRLESSRPRSPSIPATPSTNASGEPGGDEDDQTLSGSDNEERQAALQVDWDAMEEVFRPQIEAKRAANASRHGVSGAPLCSTFYSLIYRVSLCRLWLRAELSRASRCANLCATNFLLLSSGNS